MVGLGSPVFPQSSGDKESIVNARQRDASRKKRDKERSGLTMPQAAQLSEAYYYPTDTMTWGKGFSEGFAKITVKGKAGFIDLTGKVVIAPRFRDAGQFSAGLAPFQANNGKWGFIDKSGTITITPKFDWAFPFCEDRALVQVGERWGYIATSGKLVIPATYEQADSFSEGFAAVSFYDKEYIWPSRSRPNGKWRSLFIDKDGKVGIDVAFDGIDRGFDCGMAIVSRNLDHSKGVISQTYVIDRTGKDLWVLDSWYVSHFSENSIVIATGKGDHGRDVYSYLGRDGKRLMNRSFDYLAELSEGVAAARLGHNEGFIDRSGEFVIPPKFDNVASFSEGLAGAASGKWGFIDKTGEWVIQPQFDWVGGFSEGAALVASGERTGTSEKTGYIDRTGQYIWTPTK